MRNYPHKNFSMFLVKCGYHGNALSYPSYITFTHIYTSISSIQASSKKCNKTMNEELSVQFFKMFLVKLAAGGASRRGI